jgi:hypothetical protein
VAGRGRNDAAVVRVAACGREPKGQRSWLEVPGKREQWGGMKTSSRLITTALQERRLGIILASLPKSEPTVGLSFRKADMTESCLGALIPRPKELMSYSSLAVMPNSKCTCHVAMSPPEPRELPPAEFLLLCKDGNGIGIRC